MRAPAPAPAAVIPGIADELLSDFLAVRKAKRAGPLTGTAIAGLKREADMAGLTLAEAITYCCEAGWQGFNATWYADRQVGSKASIARSKTADRQSRHSGFSKLDYTSGVNQDGSFV